MSAYKNWRGPIATGLVDVKHIDRMGQAVWLFLYFVCHVDSKTGETKNPTKYSEISERTGKSVSTIRRWREILVIQGYIKVTRQTHGFSIKINNWKPFKKSGGTGNTNDNRLPKNEQSQEGKRVYENEHSQVHENEHSQRKRVFISSKKSARKWTFPPKNRNGNSQKHNDLEDGQNILKEVKEVDLLSKEEVSSLIGVPPEGSAAAMKGGEDGWFN